MKRLVAVSLSVLAIVVACASLAVADIRQKLAALKAAHQAGLLTKEEYEKKKAELEAQMRPAAPTADEAAIRKKLKALEAAFGAGILSEQEFKAKKAELEAKLRPTPPPIDEATRRKLKALEAAHQAGILSDEEYKRKKAQLLGRREPPTTTKTYRSGGFSFDYPANWTVKKTDDGLLLTPPDRGGTPDNPTEWFLAVSDRIADPTIKGPQDPKVAQEFDQLIRKEAPLLKRTGPARPVPMTNGKGAVLEWEGRTPDGTVVRARAFLAIKHRQGMALVAIGLKERLEARDKVLRQIFASFDYAGGRGDAPQP